MYVTPIESVGELHGDGFCRCGGLFGSRLSLGYGSCGLFLGRYFDGLCCCVQYLLIPIGVTVILRTEVDVVLAVFGDGVIVTHTLGEPCGVLAVGVDDFQLRVLGQIQSDGVLFGLCAVDCGQLVRVGCCPLVERTDDIIRAFCRCGGLALGCGSGGLCLCRGLVAYEFDIVVTRIVGIFYSVPPCAVRDTFGDVYGLLAVAVEDDALNISGDRSGVDCLFKFIDFCLLHRLARPIVAVRPVVDIHVAVVHRVGELHGDGLYRCGGLFGSRLSLGRGSCGGLFYRLIQRLVAAVIEDIRPVLCRAVVAEPSVAVMDLEARSIRRDLCGVHGEGLCGITPIA